MTTTTPALPPGARAARAACPAPAVAARRGAGRFAVLGLAGALALLSGCGGGGVSIGIGCCYDDDPPSATLDASTTVADSGQRITLQARASDDYGVWRVSLYQVDYQGTVRLDRVYGPPLEWLVTVPDDPGGEVSWYVVAEDDAGQDGSSNVVTVDILR